MRPRGRVPFVDSRRNLRVIGFLPVALVIVTAAASVVVSVVWAIPLAFAILRGGTSSVPASA